MSTEPKDSSAPPPPLSPPAASRLPQAERSEKLRVAKKAEALFDRLDVAPRLKQGSWGNVLEAVCKAIVTAIEDEKQGRSPS